MALALLAALPAIFSAIEGAASLFDSGKRVYEQVTGTPSQATTPSELTATVKALPPDQLAAWAEAMRQEIEAYKAETDRLRVEEGEVTADLLKVLPPAAAAKVAILRMTTRPVIVLRLSHVMMLPIYLALADGFLSILNIISKAFGFTVHFELLAPVFKGEGGSIYYDMYREVLPWATLIVIAYMASRLAEKLVGKDGSLSIGKGGSLGGALAGAVGAVAGLFKKKV